MFLYFSMLFTKKTNVIIAMITEFTYTIKLPCIHSKYHSCDHYFSFNIQLRFNEKNIDFQLRFYLKRIFIMFLMKGNCKTILLFLIPLESLYLYNRHHFSTGFVFSTVFHCKFLYLLYGDSRNYHAYKNIVQNCPPPTHTQKKSTQTTPGTKQFGKRAS